MTALLEDLDLDAGDAFLAMPFAASLAPAWLHPLGASCVCPLPGPCFCGASLE